MVLLGGGEVRVSGQPIQLLSPPPAHLYSPSPCTQGFSRNLAMRALAATNSANTQAALDWLLAYGGEPGMDGPMEGAGGAEAAAAAAGAGPLSSASQQQFYPGAPAPLTLPPSPRSGGSYQQAGRLPSPGPPSGPLTSALQQRGAGSPRRAAGSGLGPFSPAGPSPGVASAAGGSFLGGGSLLGGSSTSLAPSAGSFSNPLLPAQQLQQQQGGSSFSQGGPQPGSSGRSGSYVASAAVAAGVVGVAGIMSRETQKATQATK